MKVFALAALVALSAGCATARVVRLDTGQGAPIVYAPPETPPVEIDEAAFRLAVTQFVLDLRLDVAFRQLEQEGGRRSLLASSQGLVPGVQAASVPSSYERICRQQDDPERCLSLLVGGLTMGPMERRMLALYFALDTVWEGVGEAVRGMANGAALRAMITTMIGAALVMLVAPEPVTKVMAVALTASLIAYLGTGPVWSLVQGFLSLLDESRDAASFAELERAGHRFGKVLGDNGARVLVIVALSMLGGKSAMAGQGAKMPGFALAAARAEVEGGFVLSGALSGGVQAISVSSAGALNVVLAPTAVAAVAMGSGIGAGEGAGVASGGGIQGDPDGEVHHICTDKDEVSEATGGPWTQRFEDIFSKAGLKLSDPANQVRIKGHKGPHPREYHEEVFARLVSVMKSCRSVAQCQIVLRSEHADIARDLVREGTYLRRLITKDAGN
ncbi:AHH domain-containing protein [Myxococcaceae bacterium JPH2]|nr:AHH domain-containing protein [Myxococcaceae bacterium JPH2]